MSSFTWIRTEKRARIVRRDGGRCVWCGGVVYKHDGKGPTPPYAATLDHVVPRSQGGTNHHSNLVTCCHRCNSLRGDRDAEAFALRVARAITSVDVWPLTVTILARVCRAMGTELPE